VIELAQENDGDWKALETAVRGIYVESYATSDCNRSKLANNTKLGMMAYRIIDRDARLTPFGKQLYAIRQDKPKLYDALARLRDFISPVAKQQILTVVRNSKTLVQRRKKAILKG